MSKGTGAGLSRAGYGKDGEAGVMAAIGEQ